MTLTGDTLSNLDNELGVEERHGVANAVSLFTKYLRIEELVHGGAVDPVWTIDGAACCFVGGPAGAREAWRVDLSTGQKSRFLDTARVRAAITDAAGTTPAGNGIPFERFAFLSEGEIRFEIGNDSFDLDLVTYRATKLVAPTSVDEQYGLSETSRKAPRRYDRSTPFMGTWPAWESPSPDRAFLLSTHEHNIVARSTRDGRSTALTTDGSSELDWRFDLPAHGASWAPDSRRIAAYRVDLHGVYRAPRVHYLRTQDEVELIPYAQAGGTLERTTLHILDLHGRQPVDIDLGDTTDHYPAAAAWLPDSSALVVFRMSRDCKTADVLLADANTGRTKQILRETGNSFVRVHHEVHFDRKLGLWLTPDGREVIWQSDRSGWRHLYLYRLDGHLERQLTEGEWVTHDVVVVAGGFVYFTGSCDEKRPYDVHLCRVPLTGGPVDVLTDAPGVHSITMAPAGQAFVDTHSSVSRPPRVDLVSTEGTPLAHLASADISELESLGYSAPEEFTVLAADGETELWGVLFKPGTFDPDQRYGVIEYIYGGPQIAIAPHGYVKDSEPPAFAAWAQALAQLGYITVILDARGTPGRSKAFHDASYRRWANVLADDHAEAIRQLAQQSAYVDADRVGIIGHSWGGYSAFRCLVDRSDVYRAAVCSAPGFNPYKLSLWECYMDLPQKNPDGYAFADPFPLADKAKGAVMLAVGTCDHSTWTDAVKMANALIGAGKDHEFVVLPEAHHSFDSRNEIYFWQKVAAFFESHLGARP